MYILTYLSILRLIPIQTLVIWLLVGCCESGCPVIRVTRVKTVDGEGLIWEAVRTVSLEKIF